MKNVDLNFVQLIIRKYGIWLVLAGVVCSALSYFYACYFVTPLYRANVKIYAFGRNVNNSNDSEKTTYQQPNIYSDLLFAREMVNDYREMINTRTIRDRVSGLVEEKANTDANLEKYRDEKLNYSMSVVLVRQSRIVDIAVSTPDKDLAKVLAECVAEAFVDEVKTQLQISNITIVEAPVEPIGPYQPVKRNYIIIGFLIGFLGLGSVVVLRELLDTTFKDPDDINSRLKIPLLGYILHDEQLANQPKGSGDRIVVNSKDRNHRFNIAESFRLLCTNLQYSTSVTGKNRGKKILITSSFPQEGKTFVSCNLATALAENGHKTLLINCDLRKPAVHTAFGIPRGKGIVNILVGENTFDEVANKNMFGFPLDVLTCGPIPPNPSQLLTAPQFQEFLDWAQENYEYVILDSPPALNMADAAIMSEKADGVVVVIRANRTSEELVKRTLYQLTQVKANIFGAVLNGFMQEHARQYKYRYYYEYHSDEAAHDDDEDKA